MIVFDLSCAHGHRFEGWFSSSTDYSDQCKRGLIACPQCGSENISKSPMAPAIPAKGNQLRPVNEPVTETMSETSNGSTNAPMAQGNAGNSGQDRASPLSNVPIPPEVQQAMKALAEAQTKALQDSKWVGDDFAEKSRAMHYGETELEAIHGKATMAEAKELLEEGVELSPLPFPIAEPDDLN